jgi:hypothetical protein
MGLVGMDVDIREPVTALLALAKAWPISAWDFDMVNSKK